jgi:transcription elongation factor GreB
MKTPYITAEGEKALRDELQYLWKIKRPEVTRAVSEAAAMGDRSENAEYIYGKKQLREIDRRVRFLTKRLEELKIVTQAPDNQALIFFGAWVVLESEEGDILRYRLVGVDEIDLAKGYISIDAPLSRALLKKQKDDEVVCNAPEGEKWYTVLEVSYRAPSA